MTHINRKQRPAWRCFESTAVNPWIHHSHNSPLQNPSQILSSNYNPARFQRGTYLIRERIKWNKIFFTRWKRWSKLRCWTWFGCPIWKLISTGVWIPIDFSQEWSPWRLDPSWWIRGTQTGWERWLQRATRVDTRWWERPCWEIRRNWSTVGDEWANSCTDRGPCTDGVSMSTRKFHRNLTDLRLIKAWRECWINLMMSNRPDVYVSGELEEKWMKFHRIFGAWRKWRVVKWCHSWVSVLICIDRNWSKWWVDVLHPTFHQPSNLEFHSISIYDDSFWKSCDFISTLSTEKTNRLSCVSISWTTTEGNQLTW